MDSIQACYQTSQKSYPVILKSILSELRQIWLLDLFITCHHNISSYPTANIQSLQLCQEVCCSLIYLPPRCASAFQIRGQPWYGFRDDLLTSKQDNIAGHLELNLWWCVFKLISFQLCRSMYAYVFVFRASQRNNQYFL